PVRAARTGFRGPTCCPPWSGSSVPGRPLPGRRGRAPFRLVVEVEGAVPVPDEAHLVVPVHLPNRDVHAVVLLGGHLAGGRVRVPQELPRPADSVVEVTARVDVLGVVETAAQAGP